MLFGRKSFSPVVRVLLTMPCTISEFCFASRPLPFLSSICCPFCSYFCSSSFGSSSFSFVSSLSLAVSICVCSCCSSLCSSSCSLPLPLPLLLCVFLIVCFVSIFILLCLFHQLSTSSSSSHTGRCPADRCKHLNPKFLPIDPYNPRLIPYD